MRKPRVQVASRLTHEQSNRAIALLLSMSVDAVVEPGPEGGAQILVAESDADQARELLNEEFPLGIPGAAKSAEPDENPFREAPELWFGRGSVAVVAIAAICVAVHLYVHQGFQGASRSRMIEAGAIVDHLIAAGEHWRFLTALFLHFDLEHLLSNLVTLVFVGPPLVYMLGRKNFLVIFVLAGLGGNLASYAVGWATGIKAGASGAIAGVLGALGGHALKPARPNHLGKTVKRPPSPRTFGAMAACYAMMIGVSPDVDNIAHLGGMLCGIALGRWLEPADSAPPSLGSADAAAPSEVLRKGAETF